MARVIATAFADIGFDVDVGPLFKHLPRPRRMRWTTMCTWSGFPRRRQATRHGAQLVEELGESRCRDIIVICGGVIPQQDYQFLYDHGVKAIFGPGTNIPEAAHDIQPDRRS